MKGSLYPNYNRNSMCSGKRVSVSVRILSLASIEIVLGRYPAFSGCRRSPTQNFTCSQVTIFF